MRFVRRRDYDWINHNCWEPVAGLCETGKDILTTLLKEFEEECGMSPGWKPLRILGVSDEDLQNDDRKVTVLSSKQDFEQAWRIFYGGTPADPKVWANGSGDKTRRYQPRQIGGRVPLAVVCNYGEPQKWYGPVFVLVVSPGWEPDYTRAVRRAPGEAGPCLWCTPYQLLRLMKERPDIFMGPFIPAYELLAQKLIGGTLFK